MSRGAKQRAQRYNEKNRPRLLGREISQMNNEEEPGRPPVTGRLIQVAKSAYQYPLILKQLWHTPIVQTPDQEIVYRDQKRFTYRGIRERIGRIARANSDIIKGRGEAAGILDW